MADADHLLSPERLRILALAPLPFLRDGTQTFHGGGTVFYAELLPRLARLGHQVTVIADAPAAIAGERRSGLAWQVPNLAVEWFAYEHRSSQLEPTPEYRRSTEPRIQTAIERHLRETRPDVLLIGRDVLIPYVLELCRRHGLATLVIAHGPAVAKLVTGTYPDPFGAELLDGYRRLDVVVAVAEHIAASLRSLAVPRVVTVRNVADPVLFRPAAKDTRLLAALDIASDRPVVAHVSLLRPWKRPFDIVDSAVRVLASEPRCIYLIVGTGPCRAEMEERARSLGIAASFRYAEEVVHEEMPRYMRLADVVLLPSEREGFPLVYREVQACGLALLASDIPAAREAIVPGRTGMLFRTGDVADLAAKTLALLRKPSLRNRLGVEARALAEGESLEQWADAYVHALRRAAARRAGGLTETRGRAYL